MQVHDRVHSVTKVKSHQTPDQAAAREEAHLWHGNWLADLKANKALPRYDADDLRQYLDQQKHSTQILWQACNQLAACEKDDPIAAILKQYPRPPRNTEAGKLARDRTKAPHLWEWQGHM
jgi:hypothetical protein